MRELEPAITSWIDEVTGGRVTGVQLVTAGGRLGYAVDVDRGGETAELFLQRGRAGLSAFGSFLDLEREAEVLRALHPLGVPVPRVWAADNGRNALLVDRMPGRGWFQMPRDLDEARAIARDFVGHLARWHRTPARELDLPGFAPIRTIADHQRLQVADIRTAFETQDRAEPIDALAWLMLDILENRMPDHDGEPVLLQGDTGPGNILYADGRVTAVIDWELAHVGDPMDDIAWLSWRATQHGFPEFPDRMREYEAASGHTVSAERVAYYQVNAVARLGPLFGTADMGRHGDHGAAGSMRPGGADAAIDRNADGSWVVMSMLHRRMRLQAIADAIGLELPARGIAHESEPMQHAVLFDVVLGQLRSIVERTDDRAVSAEAKGAARNVKYLKELDRNGRHFAARELDDIGELLGSPQKELTDARAELAAAAREGMVATDDYLLYHWRRMAHDDHLLRTASGALYDRTWPSVV